MSYLNDLKNQMLEQKYEESYIELCVAYAKNLIDKRLPVIFDKEHLCKLMGMDLSVFNFYMIYTDNFYYTYKIPKKRGGFREIEVPTLNLTEIQRWLLTNIIEKIPISDYSYGFVKNKNIVDNAKNHINKRVVYNIDIKDFFPSITREDIFYIFYDLGYTKELSYSFSKICTYNGYLAHGSPTSPYLANLKCVKLDFSMSKLCKRIDATYSRYADDITISSNNVKLVNSNKNIIKKIIENNSFTFNGSKERIQFSNQMQEVTGLIVNNNSIKVRRRFKKDIEQQLYYCKKYGVYNHLKKINKEYVSFYKEYLYGKVNFVRMVEPEIGEKYLKELKKINWDI